MRGKVALVSGGGSGHEPLHGGFVGLGMLDAACPGAVFTSPVPEQMLAATKAVDGGAGVVHFVKNYTGDVMNFKLAAEDAADEGIDGRVGVDRRRRGGPGLSLHGRQARCRSDRAGGEDRRRGGRTWGRPGGRRGVRPSSQREGAFLRCRALLVHPAGCRKADLRSARGRDGGRHRYPWRAGAAARAARQALTRSRR